MTNNSNSDHIENIYFDELDNELTNLIETFSKQRTKNKQKINNNSSTHFNKKKIIKKLDMQKIREAIKQAKTDRVNLLLIVDQLHF